MQQQCGIAFPTVLYQHRLHRTSPYLRQYYDLIAIGDVQAFCGDATAHLASESRKASSVTVLSEQNRRDELRTIHDIRAFEDGRDVELDRARARPELLRDLRVAVASNEQPKHIDLAGR